MVPRMLEPQLLAPVKEAPEGDGWIHEVKYDGFRLLCRLEGGRARLVTRGGHDWTARFPAIAGAAAALGVRDGWLDGELVALGADGVPSFPALMRAMHGGRAAAGLAYQVWDAPYLDGRDLTHACVLERKARLEERVRGRSAVVRWSDHLRGNGPVFFRHAFAAGLEGIVSKRVGSGYRPGVRSRDWRKVKCFHTLAFRVAGHTPGLGAVLLCAGGEEDRVYAGRVNGWAREAVRRELREALAPLGRAASPLDGVERAGVRWVEPEVEVEVTALAWKPGEKLRHAVLRRVVGR